MRLGYVSPGAAHDIYGVFLDDGQVDTDATAARRAALRADRLAHARPVRPGQRTLGRVDTGDILHPVADAVEAVQTHDGRRIRCSQCHQDLGGYHEDYKYQLV